MSFKVTVLGCGASAGVPIIGNIWGNCDPKNPKNRRRRSSIFIEYDDTKLLVDTSPDMREQLIDTGISTFDAIFYTHEHADHTHGIDDLRLIYYLNNQKSIPVYTDQRCMNELHQRFPYLFGIGNNAATPEDFNAFLEPHIISTDPFTIKDIPMIPFIQDHGTITSLGFRIEDFAYSTDAVNLDETAFEKLKGIKVWVVDCLRMTPSKVHAHLDKTLEWIDRVNPEQAYFTQMSADLDYDKLCQILPSHIRPAYDGLTLNIR
jgi:phosphoribosyl 1,2-cyclic phosphate phosphodiesterase